MRLWANPVLSAEKVISLREIPPMDAADGKKDARIDRVLIKKLKN